MSRQLPPNSSSFSLTFRVRLSLAREAITLWGWGGLASPELWVALTRDLIESVALLHHDLTATGIASGKTVAIQLRKSLQSRIVATEITESAFSFVATQTAIGEKINALAPYQRCRGYSSNSLNSMPPIVGASWRLI